MSTETLTEEKAESALAAGDNGDGLDSADSGLMTDNKEGQQQKMNCWEFKNCGRQPGGVNVSTLGECPVPKETSLNGLHGGINAGRACWAIAHKRCSQSDSLLKIIKECSQCEFHHMVMVEEEKYQSAVDYLKKSKKAEKDRMFKQPSFIKHVFEKSKHTAFEENFEVDSIFITFLIGWVSLCPSVSMLEGSKRLCKDDLIDELMVIDAISDAPRRRALKTVVKTMTRALTRQVGGYFSPLTRKINTRKR
ncbi:MAG: hypothetical protein L3V56_09210 [Candidatus Magnetoovum sp. WYHC-5]|nr:hypothetical protein [Candidatus Magnetoovum sp. WYHC-5]